MTPRPVLDRVVAAIDAHVVDKVEESALLAPSARKARASRRTELPRFAADARKAIAEDYQPALQEFKAFVEREYRPKAPEVAGLASYPGGARYYEFLIRSRIVEGHSAKEIHEIGLAEVKRIRAEIGAIAKEVGFKGSTDEFIDHLRTAKEFFFDSSDAVLAAYRAMPLASIRSSRSSSTRSRG
jgi:uncharacterized protein (DUF885 family)